MTQISTLISLLTILLTIVPQPQNEATIDRLLVEIWPEYDRPETLIIYRGELTAETQLPVEMTFLLPSHVPDIHAIAFEQDGTLLNLNDYQVATGDAQHNLLNFTLNSRIFQFEYYDPNLLNKQGQSRQLSFRFGAPLDVSVVTFKLQQPSQATDFTLDPAANRTINDALGLTYHLIDVAEMPLGAGFTLNASYTRPTEQPSLQDLGVSAPNIPNPAPLNPSTPAPATETTQIELLGYIMMSVGLLLLLGSGGYWWMQRQRATDEADFNEANLAKFCAQCGTPFREAADFCHSCGAPRRGA